MTNALKRALCEAKKFSPATLKRLSTKEAATQKEIEHLSGVVRRATLGIEQASLARVKRRLSELQDKLLEVKEQRHLRDKYHLLSMKPLRWRNQDRWPQLVVFSIHSPVFEIKTRNIDYGWNEEFSADFEPYVVRIERRANSSKATISYEERRLPSAIQSCYQDVLHKLIRRSKSKHKECRLSCHFDGLVPQEVKERIAEVEALFQEIFLIAEPGKIRISEEDIPKPVPIKRDPLVVGFDGKQLWLIADFDTTPVEEAMIWEMEN